MTQETINQILKFRDDRDWKQFHNPKDLAISISLEASELLEVFQWSGADTSSNNKIEEIKEELADVVNYCVLMADACGLDLDEIVQTKIEKKCCLLIGRRFRERKSQSPSTPFSINFLCLSHNLIKL